LNFSVHKRRPTVLLETGFRNGARVRPPFFSRHMVFRFPHVIGVGRFLSGTRVVRSGDKRLEAASFDRKNRHLGLESYFSNRRASLTHYSSLISYIFSLSTTNNIIYIFGS